MFGRANSAYLFDGTSDYINCGNKDNIFGGLIGDLTILE